MNTQEIHPFGLGMEAGNVHEGVVGGKGGEGGGEGGVVFVGERGGGTIKTP